MPKDRITRKFIKKYKKIEDDIKKINPEKTQEYRDMVDNAKLELFNHLLGTHKNIEDMYHKSLTHINSLKKKNDDLRKQVSKLKKVNHDEIEINKTYSKQVKDLESEINGLKKTN